MYKADGWLQQWKAAWMKKEEKVRIFFFCISEGKEARCKIYSLKKEKQETRKQNKNKIKNKQKKLIFVASLFKSVVKTKEIE